MSRGYQPINWDDADAIDGLDALCIALAAKGVEWDDLTPSAQQRIERQAIAELEAKRRRSFDDAAAEAYDRLVAEVCSA